jgi:hypothetical protein
MEIFPFIYVFLFLLVDGLSRHDTRTFSAAGHLLHCGLVGEQNTHKHKRTKEHGPASNEGTRAFAHSYTFSVDGVGNHHLVLNHPEAKRMG